MTTDLRLGDPRTPDNHNALRIDAFIRLSSAASRHIDLRYAAAGKPPGHPGRVAAADQHTSLVDARAAHCLACWDVTPDDIADSGILTLAASVRRRRQR